jgi:stress-induced morphogen
MSQQRFIEDTLQEAFPGAEIAVVDTTGGGDHFSVEIVSERFSGLSMIEQHRLVYEELGERVGHEIHALGLRTRCP